jgi:hypothetical protein
MEINEDKNNDSKGTGIKRPEMVHESKESHYKQVELKSSGWVFISCFTDCHYKVVSSNPSSKKLVFSDSLILLGFFQNDEFVVLWLTPTSTIFQLYRDCQFAN